MIKTIIKISALAILLLVVAGCNKNQGNPDPGKAILTSPAQDAACITGTVTSALYSTVTFTWIASANTDSYDVVIKDLLYQTIITKTSNTNQLQVSILRNTPYSWYVISKSSNTTTTTKSDVWKFYNSGPGVISHPPFPADISAPAFGQNVTAIGGIITLSWTGSDTDQDIAAYDIYFGTATTPPLIQSNDVIPFLYNVAVTSGTTYYWKVVTKDKAGNTSDSGIFQFKVN